MRIFISIKFPKEIISEIKKIQKDFKELFLGRFTTEENLHLTLKFLGEVDKTKLNEIKNKLREVHFPRIESGLGKVGIFSPSLIRILWVEVLGKDIDEKLNELGFRKEDRFMSHLTIARIKKLLKKDLFFKKLETKIKPLSFTINKFYLMESILKKEGAEYRVLEEYGLN
jgi:2'-5' RNA ligase